MDGIAQTYHVTVERLVPEWQNQKISAETFYDAGIQAIEACREEFGDDVLCRVTLIEWHRSEQASPNLPDFKE